MKVTPVDNGGSTSPISSRDSRHETIYAKYPATSKSLAMNVIPRFTRVYKSIDGINSQPLARVANPYNILLLCPLAGKKERGLVQVKNVSRKRES